MEDVGRRWASGNELERWYGYLDPTADDEVLINGVGARTPDELREAEDAVLYWRLVGLDEYGPVDTSFDSAHLAKIHEFLFQDVYPWAGEWRTVNMAKGGGYFHPWDDVEQALDQTARQIADQDYLHGQSLIQFQSNAAEVYVQLNSIHPFREGNGRAQRIFMDELAAQAGYAIAWELVDGDLNDRVSDAARSVWKLVPGSVTPNSRLELQYPTDPTPVRQMFDGLVYAIENTTTTNVPERRSAHDNSHDLPGPEPHGPGATYGS